MQEGGLNCILEKWVLVTVPCLPFSLPKILNQCSANAMMLYYNKESVALKNVVRYNYDQNNANFNEDALRV
jgi:hypothetical protein